MKKITMIAALALGLMTIPALAVDFAQPIKKLDGTPATISETIPNRAEDKTICTLNDVVQWALLALYSDEQADGVEKSRRFHLAEKINNQRKDPQLTAEDVALIKKLVAKAFNPLVVGRAWEMLDPAAK